MQGREIRVGAFNRVDRVVSKLAVVRAPILDFGVIRDFIFARRAGKVQTCTEENLVLNLLKHHFKSQNIHANIKWLESFRALKCSATLATEFYCTNARFLWNQLQQSCTRLYTHTRNGVCGYIPIRGHLPNAAVEKERLVVPQTRGLPLGKLDDGPHRVNQPRPIALVIA
jgi:hypothetical protein